MACGLLLSLVGVPVIVHADTTYRWHFTNAVDYILSDPIGSEISNSFVRLKLLEQITYHTTPSVYHASNSVLSGVHIGPQGSVGLTKNGPLFMQGGVFVSQVFDAGVGNNQWIALSTRVANGDLATLNSSSELPPVLQGLLGLWHLNNDTVNAVSGSSGGTFGSSFSTRAKFGTYAAQFAGNNYLRSPVALPSAGAFSISFWINARQTGARVLEHPICFLDSGGSLALAIWVGGYYTHPTVPFQFQQGSIGLLNGQTGFRDDTVANVFTAGNDVGNWRHIVVVYDASTGKTIFYKDALSLAIWNDGLTGPLPAATTLQLGNISTDPTLYFDGLVDEVAVFNRLLQPDEVRNLFLAGSAVRFQVRSGASTNLTSSYMGYDGTSNTYFVGETSLFPTGGAFNVTDRYVQYRVLLDPSTNQLTSPYIQAAAFLGTKGTWFDYSQDDFLQGTTVTNVTVYPDRKDWWYIGLTKLPNGGYLPDGVFESRVLDAAAPVVWDRISWDAGTTEQAAGLSGLIGLWPMNGNFADASGGGHQGNPSFITYTPLAKLGSGCALFNGTSSRADVGALGMVQTIEFWVRSAGLNEGLLSMSAGGAPYLATVNGYVQPIGFPAGTYLYVNGSTASSRLGLGWNHVVVVIPNGVGTPNYTIGFAGGDYFAGAMDEMATYSRVLPSAEVIDHYERGRPQMAGRVRLQARSGSSVTNLLAKPYTGPGGSTNTYYSDPAGSVLVVSDEQYLQYRVYLEGDGTATPGIGAVTVTHSSKTVPAFVEDSPDEIKQGKFVSDRTMLYGEDITPVKVAAAGPFNLAGSADPALRALWHLDEVTWPAGSSVKDSSGYGRHGTPVGDAHPEFGARVGLSCGVFGGTYSYVALQPVDDLGSGDFTVALWFKTTSTRQSALISSYDGSRYYTLEINGDGLTNVPGKVAFIIDDNGVSGEKIAVSFRDSLNDNRWHHVAGVRNGTYIHIYVDGDRVGSTYIGPYGNIGASSILMLAKYGMQDIYYAGALDEVIITKRAVAEGEVGELAGAGYQVTGGGDFAGLILDGGQPVVWGQLRWGAHGPSGTALVSGDASLAGLWHMDETSGAILDYSGQNNNGNFNGVGYQADGLFGKSLNFNGTSDRVEAPDRPSLKPANLTIEAWVYPAALSAGTIVGKRDATTGYELALTTDGKPQFWLSGTPCTDLLPLTLGQWSHIAGVYDGSTMRLIVNGKIRAVALPVGVANSANPFRIGLDYGGSAGLPGRIDEVALHNRALLDEEVRDHYRAGSVTLKFQCRSGNSLPLTGPFLGPGGSTTNYFNQPLGSDLVGHIPPGRFFQYKAYLGTIDYSEPPVLRGMRINVLSYPTLNPTVEPVQSQSFPFPGRLLQYNEARTAYTNTDVKYQITGDSGITNRWFYWDATAGHWLPVDPSGPDVYTFQTNPRDVISAHIGTFYDEVYGRRGGSFRWKAYMHSAGDQPVEIDWVAVTASDGRLVLTSPTGAEVGDKAWLTGVPYPVTWTSAGTVAGTVTIQYNLLDTGFGWQTVTSGVSVAQGSVMWRTPGLASTSVVMRITHDTDPTLWDQSGAFELVKRFHVVAPDGGEKWYLGETNTIVWDAPNGVGTVNIDYSPDDTWASPVSLATFVNSQAGARTNTWTWIMNGTDWRLPSTNGKVRVENATGTKFSDASDAPFTVAGANFISPKLGEKVRQNVPYSNRWSSAACGPNVRIEVNTTGRWDLVAASVTNSDGAGNVYLWNVTASPSTSARLRVTSLTDGRAKGVSDPFIIAAIDVINPRGNFDPLLTDVWPVGTTQKITWVSAGASGLYNIYYSVDGGATWDTNNPIALNYPGIDGVNNTLNWVVDALPSPTARIRVEDATAPDQLWSMSAYNFNIAGVTIIWPNGPASQEWVMGFPDRITWQANSVGQNGLLELNDGSHGWTNVVPGGGFVGMDTGAGPLFTPTFPTVQAMVRITPTTPAFSNMLDTSDSPFTVAGILVEKPAAGDKVTIGAQTPVQFVAAGTHANPPEANLYYSGDGVNFDVTNAIKLAFVFNEAFPGRQAYNWTVETIREPSTRARVKVVAGNYSATSQPFTVRGIRFTAPSLGTLWDTSTHLIQWDVAGIVSNAEGALYLSTDGGPFTNRISIGTVKVDNGAGKGEYSWTVPPNIDPSTNAVLMIQITNTVDIGFQAFSAPFTLSGMRVTAPAAGASWGLGSTQNIQWKQAAGGALADIFYSSDAGTNYDAIPVALSVASRDGTNSYPWTIEPTRLPSAAARIKVISGAMQGESAVFTTRGIRILRPRASDIYATTDPTNLIVWAGAGITGKYQVVYYKDGVGPFAITNGLSTTSFNWSPIPGPAVGTNIQIQVSADGFFSRSDPFRVVSAATIFIASPAPGAYWRVGQNYSIRWSRGGGAISTNFAVYLSWKPYSTSNDITGTVTYDAIDNAYSMPWTATNRLGQAKIAVRHRTLALSDLSGEFNLVGSFTVWTPNGTAGRGQLLYARRPTPVTWRTIGSVPLVNVYWSTNTPYYPAASWNLISANVVNNNANDLTEQSTTWPWTLPDLRSPYVKFRVQEAAYTNLFDGGADGPFDDSDAPFATDYYQVYWDVMDATSSNKLDNLSVDDSSGWGAADLSCLTGPVRHDYPWGTWNTRWIRSAYNDKIVDWNSENVALGSPAAWTQRVYMTQSSAELEPSVLASFTYQITNQTFLVLTWMQRGPSILTNATKSTVFFYDSAGNQIGTDLRNAPQLNGVFRHIWDASAMDPRGVYWATVEIWYSGRPYRSGHAFTLQVTAGEAAIQGMINVASSNILGSVSGVSNAVSGVHASVWDVSNMVKNVQSGMTNLAAMGQVTTNLLGSMSASLSSFTNMAVPSLAFLTNQVGIMLPLVTNMYLSVTNMNDRILTDMARIITRPTEVTYGSALSILYKTRPNFASGAVTLQVFNASVVPPPIESTNMTEVIGGIYQRDLVADWGTNTFVIQCADAGGGVDSMILNVVSPLDPTYMTLTNVAALLSVMSNKLATVESGMVLMTNVNWAAITNMSDDLKAATNLLGKLDFAAITNALKDMNWNDIVQIRTNMLALTTNMSALSTMFATVEWGSLSGISSNMAAITNALGDMRWSDVTAIATNVGRMSSMFTNVDWAGLAGISSNMVRITNALGNMNWSDVVRISTNVDRLTALFGGVDWGSLSNMSANVSVITNALGTMNWNDVVQLRTNVQAISTNVANLNALFSGVEWGSLSGISSNMVHITNALGQMNWQDILNLQTAMGSVTQDVSAMRSQFTNVQWGALSGISSNMAVMTNALGQMRWSDITNLTWAMGMVTQDVAAMRGQFTNVQWGALSGISSNMALITNALGSMNWSDVVALRTNVQAMRDQFVGVDWSALSGISSNMVTITNALGQMNWQDILNLQAAMGTVTQDVAGMRATLAAVEWGALSGISSNMVTITNALGQMNWHDILNLQAAMGSVTQDVSAMRTQFTNVQWGALSGISSNMVTITNALGQMNWHDILNLQAAMGSVTQDVSRLRTDFGAVQWGALSNLSSDVGVITNSLGQMRAQFAAVNWSALTNISADVATITNALGNMNWNDVVRLTSNVDALTNNLLRVNWDSVMGMANQMANITNALGNMNWSDIQRLLNNVDTLSNSFATVNWKAITGLTGAVDTIQSKVGDLKWSDVVQMAGNVQTIQNALQGVDLTQISNIRSLVALTGSTNVISQIERRLGSATDGSSASTFFGRLAGLSSQLGGVGASAAGAQQRAGTARTAASEAATKIQTLKTELEQGKVDELMGVLDKLQSDLNATKQNVDDIPRMLAPAALNESLTQMAKTMQTFAESRGYDWLTKTEKFPEPPSASQGVSQDDVRVLRANLEQVRSSMEFMQKLLDEKRYEPVVQETLLGVP